MSHVLKLPSVGRCDSIKGRSETTPTSKSNPCYRVTISYFNCLPYPINITDRSNIVTTLPPVQYSQAESELLIEYRINMDHSVKLNWDTPLNEDSGVAMIDALRYLSKENIANRSMLGKEFIIEYRIKHSTLVKYNFNIYLEDLDIVVSRDDKAYTSVHPYSISGQRLVLDSSSNVEGFHYRVVINDPYNDFGERFVNVNGNVFRVRQTTDPSVRPGVYVHTRDYCDGDNGFLATDGSAYYPFAEADDKLKLYQTAHLAASLGDAYYMREQEIKEMEVENKKRLAELNASKLEMEARLKEIEFEHKQENIRLERENARIKDEYEHTKAEREQRFAESKFQYEKENARLKDELDRAKAARDEKLAESKFYYEQKARTDKDFYESRSYVRKDSSEVMKWLPGLIAALATIANIFIAVNRK